MVERATRELMPAAALSRQLTALVELPDSPFSHIHASLEPAGHLPSVELGSAGGEQFDYRESLTFPNSSGTFTVDVWSTEQPVDKQALALVLSAIKGFWAEERRTSEMTGLISAGSPGTREAAAETVQAALNADGGVSVMFADLDGLGSLNATHGQNTIDGVLSELAGILATAVPADVIVIHRSGDEFFLICPGAPDKALSVAYRVQRAIAEHEFPIQDEVAMSIGVCAIGPWDSWRGFKDLENRAERAFKPDPGDGSPAEKVRRGRTSMASEGEGIADLQLGTEAVGNLAKALVKSCADEASPFLNPWLNVLSQEACRALDTGEDGWGERVSAVIEWMLPDPAAGPAGAAGIRGGSSPGPTLSPEDLVCAVAHGVSRAVLEGKLSVAPEASLEIDIAATGATVRLGEVIDQEVVQALQGTEQTVEFGGLMVKGQPGPVETRRALLVKIGHRDLGSLAQIFADVITVDDRPTAGGALPDFWEASIARVVDRVEKYPDLRLVAILGDVGLGSQTASKLLGSAKWSGEAEDLAYRTGLSETVLRQAAEKLNGRVKSFAAPGDLIEGVVDVLREGGVLHPLREGPFAQVAEERFLRLRLEEREFELAPETGCSVSTGAQAFPVVLERLRQIGEKAAEPDAAGVPMIDLIDFRIHVKDPQHDQIPGFYRKDEEDLEDYYLKAFLDEEDGKFAREVKEQLPRFVAHVAHAITRRPTPFSTRRAILVVPHHLQPVGGDVREVDLSPLGLVSVRAIPRFADGKATLHFSFTWRTVEALVGLPYSLYGSLRYSQDLSSRIRGEVEKVQGSPPVQLADVSYIAHSLHVTTDAYGQNVARRIIHLAGE